MSARYDYVIAGAGFSGLVMAERLGSIGKRCLIVERRDHIGGNCYDRRDSHGLFYHVYGPHYFRTNSAKVRTYLSGFTDWHEVKYSVRVFARGRYWSFPVNLETFRQLTGNAGANEDDFKDYLATHALKIPEPANAREAILAIVGEELYQLFYEGYTTKQWGRAPETLDASVTRRIPIRTSEDDRYFQEDFQALPREGYTRMFERMLEASGADLRLESDFRSVSRSDYGHLIYTGPIDEYYNTRWGALPYRTLSFRLEEQRGGPEAGHFAQRALQINYPGPEPFTRTVELKHVTGQSSEWTNLVREFPAEYEAGKSEPYYPIPGPETHLLAEKYRSLAETEPDVTFLGRLAQYRYLNMDQIVAGALHTFEKLHPPSSSADA